jgi:hypothetical protein
MGRRAGQFGVVAPAKLAEEDPLRSAVDDRVMERDQQQVLPRPNLGQPDPKQRPRRQRERPPRLVLKPALRVLPGGHAQVDVRRLADDLDHLTVTDLEPRPQDLVPCHHAGQRLAQRIPVQLAGQPHQVRHGIARALAMQLIQGPQPPLPGRRRQRIRSRCLISRGRSMVGTPPPTLTCGISQYPDQPDPPPRTGSRCGGW